MKDITLCYYEGNGMDSVKLSSKNLMKMLDNIGQTYLIYTQDESKKDQMLKVDLHNVNVFNNSSTDLFMGYRTHSHRNEYVLCISDAFGTYRVVYDCNYKIYQLIKDRSMKCEAEKDELKQKIKELQNTITELQYQPGGVGYQEAKNHYESLIS